MNRLFALAAILALFACGQPPAEKPTTEANPVSDTFETEVLDHADWSKNATIYEVNLRQHTAEGTIAAFRDDLPRLNKLGVKILWLMPVHPIGLKNRKGSLGSYYSVQDYTGVNPEFGSLQEFKDMVTDAHGMGMKVIIDWVANHSAFDNKWTTEHPEYYLLDSLGNVQPPIGTDWYDVAQLNYENEALWDGMTDAMLFWVSEARIDGFRCDVADWVPVAFWEHARKKLEEANPDVFMLAEAENPIHHESAFDMSYSWELMHIMNGIPKGEKNLNDLENYMAKEDSNFVESAYRMTFTTNHDENSWNGTVFDRYGDGHFAFATLAFTINGMPLIYSGQEAGLDKALAFFEKDTIEWADYKFQDFYAKLIKVNSEEEALWNGHFGGDFERLTSNKDESIFAFKRVKNESDIITILNLSDAPVTVTLNEQLEGEYSSIFDNFVLSEFTNGELILPKWGYQVFTK